MCVCLCKQAMCEPIKVMLVHHTENGTCAQNLFSRCEWIVRSVFFFISMCFFAVAVEPRAFSNAVHVRNKYAKILQYSISHRTWFNRHFALNMHNAKTVVLGSNAKHENGRKNHRRLPREKETGQTDSQALNNIESEDKTRNVNKSYGNRNRNINK